MSCGPKLGYNPNASKSWLVVKPQAEEKAREIFGGTGINITTKGKIAKTEPHASYAAFVSGFKTKLITTSEQCPTPSIT